MLRWILLAMAIGGFLSGLRDLYAAFGLPHGGWPWNVDGPLPSGAPRDRSTCANQTSEPEVLHGPTRQKIRCLRIVLALAFGALIRQRLTDGYFFATVPELMVDPEYQRRGIGPLMRRALDAAPGGRLFFGAQAGNEEFFERKDLRVFSPRSCLPHWGILRP